VPNLSSASVFDAWTYAPASRSYRIARTRTPRRSHGRVARLTPSIPVAADDSRLRPTLRAMHRRPENDTAVAEVVAHARVSRP